jgi:hypothetical protein
LPTSSAFSPLRKQRLIAAFNFIPGNSCNAAFLESAAFALLSVPRFFSTQSSCHLGFRDRAGAPHHLTRVPKHCQ